MFQCLLSFFYFKVYLFAKYAILNRRTGRRGQRRRAESYALSHKSIEYTFFSVEGSHTFKVWINSVMRQRWEGTVWSTRKKRPEGTHVILWPQYAFRCMCSKFSCFFIASVAPEHCNCFLTHFSFFRVISLNLQVREERVLQAWLC